MMYSRDCQHLFMGNGHRSNATQNTDTATGVRKKASLFFPSTRSYIHHIVHVGFVQKVDVRSSQLSAFQIEDRRSTGNVWRIHVSVTHR